MTQEEVWLLSIFASQLRINISVRIVIAIQSNKNNETERSLFGEGQIGDVIEQRSDC